MASTAKKSLSGRATEIIDRSAAIESSCHAILFERQRRRKRSSNDLWEFGFYAPKSLGSRSKIFRHIRHSLQFGAKRLPIFGANRANKALLGLAPFGKARRQAFDALFSESNVALTFDQSPGHGKESLLLEKPQTARKRGAVDNEQIRELGDRYRLRFGNGDEDGELGRTKSRLMEAIVKQARNSTGGAAKIKGGTGAGAG